MFFSITSRAAAANSSGLLPATLPTIDCKPAKASEPRPVVAKGRNLRIVSMLLIAVLDGTAASRAALICV